ncbi:MAG: penicillin-binding protein 2 [Eubacteriales bacterium]|nr:penicillin-binding protein 2 [Eubacteriales bacterium]
MSGKKTKMKKPIRRLTTAMRGKLGMVFMIIVCLFFVLAVRLAYWTIRKGDEFETIVLGQQNHTSSSIAYERGKIYDRNGNILASNEKIYTLILEPKNIIDVGERDMKKKSGEEKGGEVNEVLETTVSVLHEYFGFSEKDLKKTIEENKNSYYVIYKKNMKFEEVSAFKDFLKKGELSWDENTPEEEKAEILRARKVVGIMFEENYKRVYPYKSLACRILGFTVAGNTGSWGIEQSYDDVLNGTNGRSYYYFNQELEQEQTVKDAVNGKSVVSTVDMQIQQIIEEKLSRFDKEIGSKMTSILVMNPQNGEVLGMASSNPYDLNTPSADEHLLSIFSQEEIDAMKAYTKKLEEEERKKEEEGEGDKADEATTEEEKKEEKQKTIYDGRYELWRNPIISDTNEPGSTYKPFTVAAGLESGILLGNEAYFCTGSLPVGRRNIGCSHVHGNISLKDAVAKSCNVSMMNIAFKEGADLFYQYQNNFGFGRKTGIDLPGEAETGTLVYTAETCENSATLATNAFGQNFNCSMMQMAAGFASLINGGHYYKPHVVKEIQNDSGDVVEEIEPEVVRDTISEETSKILRSYLKETVETGTGTKAQIPGYSIGGKTGTAEKIPRNKEDYYISFMGFAPAEVPEVLIYVTIDEPNVDHQANAALAVNLEKECMEEIVKVLGIEPTEELTEEEKQALEEKKALEEAERASEAEREAVERQGTSEGKKETSEEKEESTESRETSEEKETDDKKEDSGGSSSETREESGEDEAP